MYHPWRALRSLGERVRLHWVDLGPDTLGVTDGHERIWMSPDQDQVTRRCTLAHELAHIELGHVGGASEREEREATLLAARNLIHMPALLDALRWTEELEELADVLWVDIATLMARLDGLTADERAQIVDLHESVGRGC